MGLSLALSLWAAFHPVCIEVPLHVTEPAQTRWMTDRSWYVIGEDGAVVICGCTLPDSAGRQ